MSLGEGVSARISYKAYASGAIATNAQAVSASDLDGSTGGQILRRVSCSLSLGKDTYQSAEVRGDRQIADFRHGTKRVQGSISGELSPGTYWDFFEAVCRGTEASAVTASQSDFTSVSADNGASKFIFSGGNPVTKGLRVGMVMRFSSLSDADNNSKNFLITGFGGTSNREVSVYPAPDTMTADSSFSLTTVGKRISVPSSGFVSRKFGIEVAHLDLDIARLFTECRVGGLNLNLPATGMSTIEIPMMGRDMETYEDSAAPFFVSPASETTTGLLAAVNGLLRVGGVNQGVITGAQINIDLSPSAEAVVGQDFVPEIFLGRANVTGQLTAFLEDLTLIDYFKNESDVEVLLYLLTSSDAASDFMTIYLPKVKFGDAQIGIEGEQGIPITMPLVGLKYGGSGAGIDQTTIAICDSAA